MHPFNNCSRNLIDICRLTVRLSKVSDDSPLPLTSNLSVAQKGCQHLLVAKFLAPRLKVLWRFANLLTELDKGIAEAMGIKIGQTRSGKGIAENRADR